MTTKAKGLHQVISLSKDDQLLAGSFTRVVSFEATPDSEIVKRDYLGEGESDGDINHNGWDFTFVLHEHDTVHIRFYQEIAERASSGLLLPNVNLTVVTRYPDPSVRRLRENFQEVVIKQDARRSSGRKEYIETTFTGFAKRRQLI